MQNKTASSVASSADPPVISSVDPSDFSTESLVQLAASAGEIMLQNGAEISRVEDTITRILRTQVFDTVDAFVVPSGVFVSVADSNKMTTAVRRVHQRTFNLDKICMVNNLSRHVVNGQLSLSDAAKALKLINTHRPYPVLIKALAMGVACFSFTYMYGGSIVSALYAFVIAALAYLLNTLLSSKNVYGVLCTMITAAFIAALSAFASLTGTIETDKVIIGGIMQLVPGIGLTNAIRDAFAGDYMSAVSRLLDALLVAVSIASGVGVVLRLWIHFIGGM